MTHLIIFIGLLLFPLFPSTAFANIVDFVNEGESDERIDGLYWKAGPYEVDTQTKNGKEVRVAKLQGVYIGKDGNVISLGDSLTTLSVEKSGPIQWGDYRSRPEDPAQKEGRKFTIDMPLNENPIHLVLVAIDPDGEKTTQEFDLKFEETRQNFWVANTQVYVPLGLYTNTSASGSSMTTTLIGNAYELGGEIAWFRALHPYDRTFELAASMTIGALLPTSTLYFPFYGRGSIQARFRNALGSAQNGGRHGVSPLLAVDVESQPIGAFRTVADPAGQVLQVRLLTLLWATVGARYRLEMDTRWLEFFATFSYTLRAISFLSATGGPYSHQGWKVNLKAYTPIYWKLYGGVEGVGMSLGGDAQITGYAGTLVVGIKF